MTAVEVDQKKWEQFCDRVQATSQGAMVTIDEMNPDGSRKTIVQNMPLLKVALDDKSDPCNTNLIIEAGLPNQKPIRHVVVEPIHIRAKNETGDRYNTLQIEAENGNTIVHFHPGLNPAWLKDFQP